MNKSKHHHNHHHHHHNGAAARASRNRMELNKNLSDMLVNWLNLLNLSDEKIQHLSDLKDGLLFYSIIKEMLKSRSDLSKPLVAFIESENTNVDLDERYDLIRTLMESELQLNEGLDYDLAKNGCEWELAKISLILLMNGVNNEIHVISNASDLLDSFQYQSVTNFYMLMENQKLRVNNLTIKFYEDFLSMSENKRRSIAKENAPPLTPKSKFTGNYPTSPMQKISLNSPRDKTRRKAEEELALEKKKFDKELNDKEILILELQYELKEKCEQISQYTYQLQECRRKMSELLNFKEKAEEYESLVNKIDALEKEKKYYEEKLAKQTCELKELKDLRELKQRNENQIQYLTSENTRLESKDRQNYTELTRLRKCEQSLAQANQLVETKESTICELINKCSHLELSQSDLNAQFKKKKYELDEMIDDLNGQKAFLESEVNSLKARLVTVQSDGESKANEYESRVNELTTSLESSQQLYARFKSDADKAIAKLEETVKRLSEDKARLETRNNELNIELTSLRDELENSTKRIANSSSKLREQAEQIVQLQAQYSELERKYTTESEQGRKEQARLNKSLDTRQAQIDELKEQLHSVEGQLKERTHQFESELADFRTENQKLTETIENRNGQIQMLKEDLTTCERELEENKAKIAELTSELSDRVKDVALLEDQVKSLEGELTQARTTHQHESETYQSQLNDLNDQLTGRNKQLDEFREKLEETSSHLFLLREQSANDREQSEADRARLEATINAGQTHIDELRHNVEQLTLALNESRHDGEQFKSERDKFSQHLAEKEAELGLMRQKVATLGQQVTEANTLMQTRCEDYERENRALGESIRQREGRIEELTRDLGQVKSVLADTEARCEEQKQAFEGEKAQLSSQLDAKLNELSQLGEKLDGMKRELEDLNGRLRDDAHQHESAKSQLEESLKQKQNEIDSLVGDLQLMKDKCFQQDAENNQATQSNQLLKVELESKQTQLDELKVYIAELEVQLNERGKRIDDLSMELSGKASDFTKLEQYLNDVQKDREEESKQYELELDAYKVDSAKVRGELEAQLTGLRDQLVNSEESSVKLKQDYEEQLARLRETNEQEKKTLLGELEDAYSECKAKLDENYKLQNELAKLDELNREYNTKQEQAEKMLNEMQSSYNNEKVKLTQEIKSLKTTLGENKATLDEMNAARVQLEEKLQQVLNELTLKNESLGRIEMEKAQLEKTNSELGSVKDNMLYQIENNNKQLVELKQHLTACQNELNAKQIQLNEKQSQLQTIEMHRVNLEKEYTNMKQSFDGVFKERTQMLAELTEKNKKLMDMEISFNQALTNETNKMREDFQQLLKNHQEHIVKLESRVNELTKEREGERDRVNRCREEITQKQNELEMIQKKLKLSEEKEKTFANKLEYERDRVKSLNEMLEKDKQQMIKLNLDLESKIKLNEELTAQNKSLRDYSTKYEEHYKQKKRIFEDTEALNKDLKAQLEQSDRDLNELKMKVIQNESRNRALVDELNFLKEKIKTVSFENQHLKSTKEDLMKKLSGVTMADNSQFEPASVKFAKPTVLSTPKGKCSFDDSYVKYTSPEMRTSEMFFDTTNQDEQFSRRFSIDSFSRSSMNAQSQNATMMPQFNRFNTISEHEFEEPDINRKSLHIEHPSTNVNRLSTLLIRNQQAKPHLKCSYALESMLPDVPEDQIKGRENKQQQQVPQPQLTSSAKKSAQSTTSSYQKRRNDDPPESNSPKKSHMAGIKQTHF